MRRITNNELGKLIRKMAVSGLLVIIVVLAFASKGGGGEKKNTSFKMDFTPIRSTNGFTLKTVPVYSGSYSFTHEKENNRVSVNTSITYQRGNTMYILPYKYKVNSDLQKPNLQFIGVKIKMPK